MDSNHFYTISDYQPKVLNEEENRVELCQVILGVTATTRTLLPLDIIIIPHLLDFVKHILGKKLIKSLCILPIDKFAGFWYN